jgi:hypothetical protein
MQDGVLLIDKMIGSHRVEACGRRLLLVPSVLAYERARLPTASPIRRSLGAWRPRGPGVRASRFQNSPVSPDHSRDRAARSCNDGAGVVD